MPKSLIIGRARAASPAASLGLAALLGSAGIASADVISIIDPDNPTFTQALGINNSSTIVGYGNATNFNGYVLTLPSTFTRENFPNPSPPPATQSTQVTGIDAAGDTVGFYINSGTTNGFYRPSGGAFATVNQPGFAFNQLLGINQAGTETVGYSSTDPTGMTGQQAFSSNGSTFTNINALLPVNFNSQATGVNNSGTVVGFYQTAGGMDIGFKDIGGTISSIVVPGSVDTMALGINDLGEVVGDYTLADGDMFGFLDNGGTFTSLDAFGSTAVTANGINDGGDIVGFYTDALGNTDGFLETPASVSAVPEPASLSLLGGGLIALGIVRRRKRKAA